MIFDVQKNTNAKIVPRMRDVQVFSLHYFALLEKNILKIF